MVRVAGSTGRWGGVLRVWVAVLVLAVGSFCGAARADDATPDWVQRLCNSVGETMYGFAWPTATYHGWSFAGLAPASDAGVDLAVRLDGESGWDGSYLYTFVILTVDANGIRNLRWGRNNGTFAPGSTVRIMANAVADLERQYEASQTQDSSSPRLIPN